MYLSILCPATPCTGIGGGSQGIVGGGGGGELTS